MSAIALSALAQHGTRFAHGSALGVTNLDNDLELELQLPDRHPFEQSGQLDSALLKYFPSTPHDLSADDVADFDFEYDANRYTIDFTFDGADVLAEVSLNRATYYDFEISRCNGVVVESFRLPPNHADSIDYDYYYGCDDFVLPD